jgi:radical SAM superfamily enzyme YgiQ (UPF0313 family)
MHLLNKILLVNPVYKRKGYYGKFHSGYQPLALGVLAALTPERIKIVLIDEKFEKFEDVIAKEKDVSLIGITGYTSNIIRAYQIADKAREMKIPVVMGGIHVSFNVDEALLHCDSVVIGEAEGLWEKVLRDVEDGNLKKIYKHENRNMRINPARPRRDIFDKYNYRIGGLQTARGCPMNCDFCSVTEFNGFQYRKREIEDIINEIKQIKQRELFFYDDNIVGRTKEQREHSIKLFKRMVECKVRKLWSCQASLNIAEDEELLVWMYRSGCRLVLIGFESTDYENLKAMHKTTNLSLIYRCGELIKRIHQNGIAILGAFIIGYPNDNYDTVERLVNFINKYKIDMFIISYLTPLPGTALFKRMLEEGRIITNNYPEDWTKFEFAHVVFKHNTLSKQQIEEIMYRIRYKITVPFISILKRFINTLIETRSISTAFMSLRYNYFYRKQYVNRLRYLKDD